MKNKKPLLPIVYFALCVLAVVNMIFGVHVIKHYRAENRLEVSRECFQDSIANVYKDSLRCLKYENEQLSFDIRTSEENADNGWRMYENLQRITDSIAKSKVKYVNVNSMLKNQLPKDKERYKMEVYFSKEEWDYLNRFNGNE